MIDLPRQRYAFLALAASALFGASTPLAKLLLGEISPVVLAGCRIPRQEEAGSGSLS